MDAEPTFDIFKGATKRNAERIESVAGLLSALYRIEEIAAAKPGQYFLFDSRNRSTLVKIDSRKSLLRSEQEAETRKTA
jgi:hypothetical protein